MGIMESKGATLVLSTGPWTYRMLLSLLYIMLSFPRFRGHVVVSRIFQAPECLGSYQAVVRRPTRRRPRPIGSYVPGIEACPGGGFVEPVGARLLSWWQRTKILMFFDALTGSSRDSGPSQRRALVHGGYRGTCRAGLPGATAEALTRPLRCRNPCAARLRGWPLRSHGASGRAAGGSFGSSRSCVPAPGARDDAPRPGSCPNRP
jgi:hypothetical protein